MSGFPPVRQRGRAARTVVAAVAVVALLGGAAWVIQSRKASRPATPPPSAAVRVMELAPMDVGEVLRGPLEQSIPLSGTLQPYARTVVKSKVAGEVRDVRVREGTTVRRGDVLAELDDTELRARVAEKRAALEAARAQLDLARKNWAMNEQLLEQKFISRNAADTVANGVEVARANMGVAEAQLELARKALSDARVVAPMSGIVAERFSLPGEKVPVDARIVSLVDLSRLELEADVPASDIGLVAVGAAVTFRIEGLPDRAFEGRVERINPTADERSRTVKVYAVLSNADGQLRGGMFAKGQLAAGTVAAATLAPIAAVREEGTDVFVYTVAGETVERRAVRLGVRDPGRGVVQVLEGLEPGARVLNANLGNVRPGDRVRVAAPKKPSA
jgi:RND family efflux transporter MFP subunit